MNLFEHCNSEIPLADTDWPARYAAKGLEWPVVIVIDMNEGTMPANEEPEERNIAYVAMTRAREALHLHAQAPGNELTFNRPAGATSRYITEQTNQDREVIHASALTNE